MSIWIELHGDVFANRKIVRAAGQLTGGDVEKMVGHMARLWTWALENAESGELQHLPPQAIAHAANWRGRPKRFIQILRETELLTPALAVANWSEFAGKLVERRKKDRERKKKERADGVADSSGIREPSAGHPTEPPPVSDGSPGAPYPTVPDRTEPIDDDSAARVEDALRALRRESRYPYVEGRDREAVARFADQTRDLEGHVERFLEVAYRDHNSPRNPRAALVGWLKKIPETDAAVAEAEATLFAHERCSMPGCEERGAGTPRRCWGHHPSNPVNSAAVA